MNAFEDFFGFQDVPKVSTSPINYNDIFTIQDSYEILKKKYEEKKAKIYRSQDTSEILRKYNKLQAKYKPIFERHNVDINYNVRLRPEQKEAVQIQTTQQEREITRYIRNKFNEFKASENNQITELNNKINENMHMLRTEKHVTTKFRRQLEKENEEYRKRQMIREFNVDFNNLESFRVIDRELSLSIFSLPRNDILEIIWVFNIDAAEAIFNFAFSFYENLKNKIPANNLKYYKILVNETHFNLKERGGDFKTVFISRTSTGDNEIAFDFSQFAKGISASEMAAIYLNQDNRMSEYSGTFVIRGFKIQELKFANHISFNNVRVYSTFEKSNELYKSLSIYNMHLKDMCLLECCGYALGLDKEFKKKYNFTYFTEKMKKMWKNFIIENLTEEQQKEALEGNLKYIYENILAKLGIGLMRKMSDSRAKYNVTDEEEQIILLVVGAHSIITNKKRLDKYFENNKLDDNIFEIYGDENDIEFCEEKPTEKDVYDVKDFSNCKLHCIIGGKKDKKKNEKEEAIHVCYDIESYQDKEQVPFLLCYDVREKENIIIEKDLTGLECCEKFCDELKELSEKYKDKVIYCTAHNGGSYDHLFLIKYLLLSFDYRDIHPVGETTNLKVMRVKNIIFIDTKKILNDSLNNISKNMFNETKMEFDVTSVTKENYNECLAQGDVIYYCRKDVNLLSRIVKELEKIYDEFGFNKFIATANAASLKLFKLRFPKVKLMSSPKPVYLVEKMTSRGGYTETFRTSYDCKEDENIVSYDIHSSYVKTMTEVMPYKFQKYVKLVRAHKATTFENHYIYGVSKYKFSNKNTPNLASKFKQNSVKRNICFLESNTKNYYWGCELNEAMKYNKDCEIYVDEVFAYEGREVFKEFMEELWEERNKYKANGNKVMEMAIKLISNSFFGGFGRRNYGSSKVSSIQDIIEQTEVKQRKLKDVSDFGGYSLAKYEDESFYYKDIGTLCRFSSYIMAKSRTRLFSFIHSAEENKIPYLYCDTDSLYLVMNERREKRLDKDMIDPEGEKILGRFGFEKSGKHFISLGAKMVRLWNENKTHFSSKGVPKYLHEKLTEECFRECLEGKEKDISGKISFIKSVNDGLPSVDVREVPYKLKMNITKRRLIEDRTRPYKNVEKFLAAEKNDSRIKSPHL